MTERAACCVPFCRRTTGKPYSEWICGDHWRAVPMALRRAKAKAYRDYRRSFGSNGFWHYPPGSQERLNAIAAGKVCDATWETAKAAAIERGMGI